MSTATCGADHLHNAPGLNGVETELTFNFRSGSLTDHKLKSDGSLGAAESFSFGASIGSDTTTSATDRDVHAAAVPAGAHCTIS
jgi:hypothetical protein